LPRACSSSPGALRRNITNARIDTGPFWEDRYHATAVEADEHLHRCIVYIDLNMVRAGAVNHPFKWAHSGYREIQKSPKRYAIIDLRELTSLCGFADSRDLQVAHHQWVEQGLENGLGSRDDRWSESIAVGNLAFVGGVKSELASKAAHRDIIRGDGSYALRELEEPYGLGFAAENEVLRAENTFFWDETVDEQAHSVVRPE
jgi:hypothetical protein